MKKISVLAVACVMVTGAWAHQEPPVSPVGCWSLAMPNAKNSVVPNFTKIQFDTVPARWAPTHKVVTRISAQIPEIVEEHGDWYFNPGDNHVIFKLGDERMSVTFDTFIEGDRLEGKVFGGTQAVRGKRTKCPK